MIKAEGVYVGNRLGDLFLQIVFVIGLIAVVAVFYFSRVGGLKADDKDLQSYGFENLQTAFQFEQEELKIRARISVLKVDYANDLLLYRAQIAKIDSSTDYSELEKREKLKVLRDLYSTEYFERKSGLLSQENLNLENLLRLKCAKFCTSDDLSRVQR